MLSFNKTAVCAKIATISKSFALKILNIFSMFSPLSPALKDKRYSIDTLSVSEFTISISNVNFNDGGNYTCSQYHHQIAEKKVEVTVLGEFNSSLKPPKTGLCGLVNVQATHC